MGGYEILEAGIVRRRRLTMPSRPPYPHVHQINLSDGGVPKLPVWEASVGKEGLSGDRQRNLKFHGGPDRAVCLYSLELIERLQLGKI